MPLKLPIPTPPSAAKKPRPVPPPAHRRHRKPCQPAAAVDDVLRLSGPAAVSYAGQVPR